MVNSISKQLAQQIVDTIHDVCGYHINFINTQGKIYASSNPERIETFHEIGRRVAVYGETIEVTSDDDYEGTNKGINIPIYHHKRIIAVVGISGEPTEVRRFAHLAERISNILLHEQELSEEHRNTDEKKLYIIRSLQDGVFNNHAYLNECFDYFKIERGKKYRMVKMEVNTRYNLVNISLLEQHVESLFSTLKGSLYAYIYPNQFVGLISESTFENNSYMFEKFSKNHSGIVKISVGKLTKLEKCNESWESAETALSSIKNKDSYYVVFDDLTLEILISGLAPGNIEEYRNKILTDIDEEDIEFLKVYYENNMSLAKTSEKLYLHKNTVQQRLKRIYSQSGYDPRNFQDAVLFYLACRL